MNATGCRHGRCGSGLPDESAGNGECLPGGCGASDGGSGETSDGLTEVRNAVLILLVIACVAIVAAVIVCRMDCGPVPTLSEDGLHSVLVKGNQ